MDLTEAFQHFVTDGSGFLDSEHFIRQLLSLSDRRPSPPPDRIPTSSSITCASSDLILHAPNLDTVGNTTARGTKPTYSTASIRIPFKEQLQY